MPSSRPSLAFFAVFTLLLGCEPLLVEFPGDRDGIQDGARSGFAPPQGGLSAPTGEDSLPGPGAPSLDLAGLRPAKGDEPSPPLPGTLGGCPAVTSQSGWCATLQDTPGPGTNVMLFGLDDGQTCEASVIDVGVPVTGVGSLGLQGTTLAFCDASGALHYADLSTGAANTVASASTFCGGVTSSHGGWALLPQALGRDVRWYARLSELANGSEGISWPVRPWATRLAGDTDVTYAAWHEAGSITRWQRDGTQLEDLELPYTQWVFGLDSVLGDRLVILDENRTVATYDTQTGELIDELVLDGTYHGLACFPEP